MPLLEVKNLTVSFDTSVGPFKAVDGIDYDVQPGETLGIIGESGSGKTTLGRALVSLLQPTEGHILQDGVDPAKLNRAQLRKHRRDYQIVFQDPNAALNPRIQGVLSTKGKL